tara:strand:+ start:667 stop:882 length:216 start_codon:yes stop_codon:yes gene_type:complete
MSRTIIEAKRGTPNPDLPPPNWSPTGNGGWWVRDTPEEKWRWIDDELGDASEQTQPNKEYKKQKQWWEVWK